MKLPALVLLGLATLATAAAAPGAEKVFAVAGVIRAPLDHGEITVAHQDIADYMPAMTMRFAVADPAEASALRAGDRVEFRLHVTDASSQVSDFIVLGRESVAPAARAAGAPKTVVRLREGDALPEISLRTEQNQPLTAGSFRGHATIVTFMFTRCPIPEYCPAMALRFGQLQRAIVADPSLAAAARLLSITLDPDHDQASVLEAYGRSVGANPRIWNFATGSDAEITALTKAFSVYAERNGVALEHTLCTALVDGNGRVREIWRGNGWQTQDVLSALRAQTARFGM